MRARLLAALCRIVAARPRTVLLCALLATLAAAALIPGLTVKAGHSSMFAADDPHQQRFEAFQRRFGSPNLLFVLVEGGSPRARRAVIDGLGARLPGPAAAAAKAPACAAQAPARQPGCVRDVVGRVDLEAYQKSGMLYLPLPQLRALVDALADEELGLPKILGARDLADLIALLSATIERRANEPAPVGDAAKQAAEGTAMLAKLFEELTVRVRDPRRAAVPLEEALVDTAALTARAGIDAAGYFASRDGKLALALVRPVHDEDDPRVVVPFVRYVRTQTTAELARVTAGCRAPRCAMPDGPLRATVTGLPALIADENELLTGDLLLTSVVSATGIFMIFAFASRSIRQGLLGMVPLIGALACTLAFVRLAIGELNMVTAAFISTMLGLGIDFFIHLLARYNEARWDGARGPEAVQRAIRGAGPGILTGAVTTAGAFLALSVNRFKGFSDLGIITAVGLIFALLAVMITAAALSTEGRFARFLQQPPRPRRPLADETRGLGGWIVAHRKPLIGCGLLLTAAMIWRAPRIPWSYNYLELLPSSQASVQGMRELVARTEFSGELAAVEARSLAEARALTAALERRPTVGRVESLASYLPERQQQKRALLARLEPALVATAPAAWRSPPAVDVAALDRRLEELSDELEDARFAAKRGDHPAAQQLRRPAAAVATLRRAIADAGPATAAARLGAVQRELLGKLDRGLSLLRANVEAQPVTVERLLRTLPAGVGERLFAAGRFAIYAHSKHSVWEGDNLPRFVADVRAVQPDATGFTVTHWEANALIHRGFRDASLLTGAVLVLLILIDFRSLRFTALALVPLALGIPIMLGVMSLAGMHYNFANIIAFPLVIGIGVASGVHMLHRFEQEGRRNVAAVVRHTGLAIFLSAVTTQIGFGALILARHAGAAALGMLMVIGVGACLLVATFFLPALLAMLPAPRRNR